MSEPIKSFAQSIDGQAESLVFNHGIEREALRVDPTGNLALTPHPAALGSKLTHPSITTDFSEAQLELITPVHTSIQASLDELDLVHRYVYSKLDDEILWSASMPCMLPGNDEIPLAYYGESNLGRLKTTYRNGLGYRYGRSMQTICAVHYNFSFSDAFWQWLKQHEGSTESDRDFVTKRYFDLMRNFRRYSWLLTYLFGASPAVCNSFLKDKSHDLQSYDEGTAYLPHATSLRSGKLGYQSDAQTESLNICFNSLESYVGSLADAICEPYADYEQIGAHVDDEYRQVNCNVLQSEAEFYSSIRAKRVPAPGQNFLAALSEEGVQYIEVRLLDVNPYLPLGIDAAEMQFIDTFLLYCLMSDSPAHNESLCKEVQENMMRAVHEGRSPTLQLSDDGQSRALTEWGQHILGELEPLAAMLEANHTEPGYVAALKTQKARLDNPDLTPSGMILKDLENAQVPYFRFAMNQALAHRQQFLDNPPSAGEAEAFDALSATSVAKQKDIESADAVSFDDYLAQIAREYLPLCQGS